MVLHAMGVGDAYSNVMVSSPMVAEELLNPKVDKFYKLLKAVEESLWDGCTKQSKLSACIQLLNMKSTLNLTQTAFNKFMCPNYYMLYYEVDAMKKNCDFYGSLRYKLRNPTSKGSNKLEKQL